MKTSQTWPARRIDSRSIEAGGYRFVLAADPPPEVAAAEIVALRAGVDGDDHLWIELYVRRAAPPDNDALGEVLAVGVDHPLWDIAVRELRSLYVAPARWEPMPESSVTMALGEFVEVIAGPCGDWRVRPRIGPMLERMLHAGASAAVAIASTDADDMLRAAEDTMRSQAPRLFAALAVTTSVVFDLDEPSTEAH